jgi:hypothetical protein
VACTLETSTTLLRWGWRFAEHEINRETFFNHVVFRWKGGAGAVQQRAGEIWLRFFFTRQQRYFRILVITKELSLAGWSDQACVSFFPSFNGIITIITYCA